MGNKKPLRMIRPPTWDLVLHLRRVTILRVLCMLQLAHVPINIIYNTRLLKRCQHMTVTYVVVTLAVVLAAVLPDYFRLSDPNKDHNPFVL